MVHVGCSRCVERQAGDSCCLLISWCHCKGMSRYLTQNYNRLRNQSQVTLCRNIGRSKPRSLGGSFLQIIDSTLCSGGICAIKSPFLLLVPRSLWCLGSLVLLLNVFSNLKSLSLYIVLRLDYVFIVT